MRASKIKALVLLVFFISLAALAGNIVKKPAAVKPEYTVEVLESMRSPYYLPQYLAQNLGFFKEQNLNVSITTTSPQAIMAALSSGRSVIVLCGMQKIIFNPQDASSTPMIFAGMARKDGSLLLARPDHKDFQWSNLKHKSIISGSHDDSSSIAMEYVLRQHGLSPYRGITVYYNIPDDLRLGAFRTGSGQYIQMLEPQASTTEINGFGKVVASVGEAAGDMTVTAYAALPEYIEANPQAVQGFTNAIHKALLWLSQHTPEEAAAVAAPYFPGLPEQVLLSSIKRYQMLGIWADSPLVHKKPYEKFCLAARESGEIITAPPYAKMVTNSFAEQAAATVIYSRELEEQNRKKRFFEFKRSNSQ